MSGIIYDFLLYAGDDTFRGIAFTEEEKTMGVGSKIVLASSKTTKLKRFSEKFRQFPGKANLKKKWYLNDHAVISAMTNMTIGRK